MSWDKVETAQRVRDVVRRISGQETETLSPRPTFGRVVSIDFVGRTATVWFPGDDAPVTVKMFSSTLPGQWQERFGVGSGLGVVSSSLQGYGSIVAVEKFQDSLYIVGVLNGGQFSMDWENAGNIDIAYGPAGIPDDPAAGVYTYILSWDTIGDGVSTGLPNNGGPFALNIGPFLNNRIGLPPNSNHEIEIVSLTGLSQRYHFSFNPYQQMSKNNGGSIYDRWFRVLPCELNEDEVSANVGRVLNKTNYFDQGIGDWTAFSANTTVVQSSAASHVGNGFAMKVQSVTGAQVGLDARENSTNKFAVISGATYQISSWGMSPTAWASGVRFGIVWYDAAMVALTPFTPTVTVLTANTWVQLNNTATAPANAAWGVPSAFVAGTPPNTQPFYFDEMFFTTADAITRTDISLEVCLRQTIHGSTDTDLSNSPGEMWIRIYMHWLNALDNPNWIVKVKNTGGWTSAKSLQTGKPVYEYVTSPPATTGYLGYHDANVGLTASASGYVARQDGMWSTGPWRNPDLSTAARAQEALCGGGLITWDGTNFKWSAPFEFGSIGRSRQGMLSAKGTLTMPTSGTIPVFPAGTTVTATANGIPLASGQALYFAIPPGAPSTIPTQTFFNGALHTTGGLFIVDSNSPLWWSPPEWAVFLAYRQSDATQAEIKCGNGEMYDSWKTLTLANSWTGTFKYRKVSPNNLQLIAALTPSATKGNGTNIATLGVGYRPLTAWDVPANVDVTVTAGQSPHINVTTAGAINFWGGASATGVSINGFLPLDV
jgi:hypothetical protein